MKTEFEHTTDTLVDQILSGVDPLVAAKIVAKMQLAARISEAIEEKGWKQKDFLAAVGRTNPSVASKWLSGTQNFTVETLVEIEQALGIRLLNLESAEADFQGPEPSIGAFYGQQSGSDGLPSLRNDAKIIDLKPMRWVVGASEENGFQHRKKA